MPKRAAERVTLTTLHTDLNAGFADVKQEVRTGFTDLKQEMRTGFTDLKQEMRTGFTDLKQEMQTGFADLKQEMRTGFTDLKQEMQTGFADLKQEVQTGFADLKQEVGGLKSEMRAGFGDLKATLVTGFASLPTRESSEEMVRLLRESNRLQEERFTQLDLRIREQHLEIQHVLRALVESHHALLGEIKTLIARLDALIRGRGDGSPTP